MGRITIFNVDGGVIVSRRNAVSPKWNVSCEMCRRLNVNNNNIVISFKEHRKICILLQTSHIPRSTSYPVPTNYNYNYRHPPQLCTQEEWHGAALVAEEVRRIGVANIYVGAGLRQRHSIITILYLGDGNGAQ